MKIQDTILIPDKIMN